MQQAILWKGIEYHSLEHCRIGITSEGTEVQSSIIGEYGESVYLVTYRLEIDSNWLTRLLEIESHIDGRSQRINLQSDGNGNWILNGQQEQNLHGCIDVDIPLTPLTNTLPIRRLRLNNGKQQQIKVVYCDLLENTITPACQKYTRISASEYHYQNVPNDFETTIWVDDSALVIEYPVFSQGLQSTWQEHNIYVSQPFIS
ncbi:MAG TPA: putative glycolipid-binding domain-containing protein [Flavipsychrobacter sp.]|nr:putative glycolipid-binding domain-containing protein [Flavipsychrobacter sp.]